VELERLERRPEVADAVAALGEHRELVPRDRRTRQALHDARPESRQADRHVDGAAADAVILRYESRPFGLSNVLGQPVQRLMSLLQRLGQAQPA